MSYTAIACTIKVRPHFNQKYERIQIGTIYGVDVIVSKEVEDGDFGIYFPPDGQLDEQFCIQNKLLRKHPETGENLGGYLEANRKVKAIKICEIESQGIWIPISNFDYLGSVSLKDGEAFTHVNGKEICKKFVTAKTLKVRQNKEVNKPRKHKIQEKVFPRHYDTSQWKFSRNIPQQNAFIIVTEKLHGTSGRTGNIPVTKNRELSSWEKFKKFLGFKVQETDTFYTIVNGSRAVNLGTKFDTEKPGFYGSNTFRWSVIEPWSDKIKKNELVFYEIVGYVGEKPIQKGGKITDKKIVKKYGLGPMEFSYGCKPGVCEAYVYRIVNVNPDNGDIQELSWTEIQRRCSEMGVKVVPEYKRFVYDGNLDTLDEELNSLIVGSSVLDDKHVREGVCIRVEQNTGIKVLKLKSFDFLVIEGIAKDNEDHVDMEEAEEENPNGN